jgi:hypothetical protein
MMFALFYAAACPHEASSDLEKCAVTIFCAVWKIVY